MSNELRIVLVGPAKEAHDKMLTEIRRNESVSINSSKLINCVVADYFRSCFKTRKSKILKEHVNSRKYLRELLKREEPHAIERALRAISRKLSAENGCDAEKELTSPKLDSTTFDAEKD